jgi:hypothetical protein
MENAAIPNAFFRLFSAGAGLTVSSGGALKDPLGRTIAPDHHLIAANRNDGNLVEINPFTQQQVEANFIASLGSHPVSGAPGDLTPNPAGVCFVDDATNTFNLLH